MEQDEKNPYTFDERKAEIIRGLAEEGFEHTVDYEIMSVPNITHITYGRDVGYAIEQETLGEDIESITQLRFERNVESKKKSLYKTISWRIIASCVTALIALAFGLPQNTVGYVFLTI